ncbi:MAG: hypothetical protein JWL81_2551 [Verrucomicrobiales bacterium]|nr:hypothetical protein [Verrucomicrobiales bacterium]
MKHDPDLTPTWAKAGAALMAAAMLAYGFSLWSEEPRLSVFLLGLPFLMAHALLAKTLTSLKWALVFDLICVAALGTILWSLNGALASARISTGYLLALLGLLVWAFPGTVLDRFKRRVNALGSLYEKIVPLEPKAPRPIWKSFLSAVGRAALLTSAIGLGFALPHWLHLPGYFLVISMLPAAALAYWFFDGPRPIWPYAVPFVLCVGFVTLFHAPGIAALLVFCYVLPMEFLNRLLYKWTGIQKERINNGTWQDELLPNLPDPPDGGPWKYRS